MSLEDRPLSFDLESSNLTPQIFRYKTYAYL
jgi:hypothetical protein